MTGLPLSGHPVCWRSPVRPGDVGLGSPSGLVIVADGAVAAGVRADAAVLIDAAESARRAAEGMVAVTSLPILDVLLGMPLEVPLRTTSLSDREVRVLGEAPHGCLTTDAATTTTARRLRQPVTVAAALVRATRWRPAMRRAAAFTPLAQRIVVLSREPKATETLEAQLVGVGIWQEDSDGGFVEHVAPEVFVPKFVKAAGWRFAENAFAAVLGAGLVHDHPACACC